MGKRSLILRTISAAGVIAAFGCNALSGASDLSIDKGVGVPAPPRDGGSGGEGGLDGGNPDPPDGTLPLLDGAEGPACDPLKPFANIAPIATLNSTAEDEGARLTPDELVVVFSSNRQPTQGGFDLWASLRTSRTAAWQTPVPVPGVNSAQNERFPCLRGDGLVLYFKYDGPLGAGAGDVFFSTRATGTSGFGNPATVAGVNAASDDGNPFVSPDGTTLWFGSTRTGGTDIYRATLTSAGVGTSVAAEGPTINSGVNDTSPAVTADGKTMFFASLRGGGNDRHIYVATRATTADPFGPAMLVSELMGTAGDDLPTWISADGCRIYFSSDRGGNNELYFAERGK
jgi:hypothetical protein